MVVVGAVSDDGREPMIPLTLWEGPDEVDGVLAVIDTGFDGDLTLRPETIERLGYPHVGTVEATLADGSTVETDLHAGSVSWHGRTRPVVVLAAEGAPLVGMELLAGSRLIVEAEPGGSVVVEELH